MTGLIINRLCYSIGALINFLHGFFFDFVGKKVRGSRIKVRYPMGNTEQWAYSSIRRIKPAYLTVGATIGAVNKHGFLCLYSVLSTSFGRHHKLPVKLVHKKVRTKSVYKHNELIFLHRL